MRWINHFFNSKIPFYIYKLYKGDSVVHTADINISKLLIVLHGTVYILKAFTNSETITLALLESDHIIHTHTPQKNCYYKIIAITDTFLLSCKWEDLTKINTQINSTFFGELIQSYIKTIEKYETMNSILAHKYIKNRVIQLILSLSKDFGIVDKRQIFIPHYISQTTISIITGSNRTNINKILHNFHHENLIKYLYNKKICIENPFFFIHSNHIKN
uniref:global nitrogen transcriptional regulator n=1 Tax=Catenella fusiformis TaxID=3024791 RepID=UPI0027DA05E7|nr:global nitrogen transcriptional regulator [Catenella fusiformis]WCH57610.1 global nitrogen transcriptional regulator [Catenella fusiformis]